MVLTFHIKPYSLKVFFTPESAACRRDQVFLESSRREFLRSHIFFCGSISKNRIGFMALAARTHRVVPLVIIYRTEVIEFKNR